MITYIPVEIINPIIAFIILACAWMMIINTSIDTMISSFTLQTFVIGIYIFLYIPSESLPFSKLFNAFTILITLCALVMIRIFLWPKLLRLETKHHEQLSYGKIKISSKLILTGIMLIIFSFIFANEYLAENIADGNHLSDTAKESMLSAHKTNKRINIDHSKAVLPIKKVNIDSIMIYLGVCIILLGMFVMITRSDILAQAVGLIQAENGLYLTAFVLIKNCQKQSIVVQFAIATFVFVLLTFVTLYFILRYAYEQKRTYNMNKFKELKG